MKKNIGVDIRGPLNWFRRYGQMILGALLLLAMTQLNADRAATTIDQAITDGSSTVAVIAAFNAIVETETIFPNANMLTENGGLALKTVSSVFTVNGTSTTINITRSQNSAQPMPLTTAMTSGENGGSGLKWAIVAGIGSSPMILKGDYTTALKNGGSVLKTASATSVVESASPRHNRKSMPSMAA